MFFFCSLFPLWAQTGNAGLLAYEPFDSAAGPLLAVNSGAGWASPWDIQADSESGAGFSVADASPLSYGGLPTAGNYAVGGYQFFTAGRHFDTSLSGSFRSYVSDGLIGQAGQTIYLSALMRKDGVSHDAFYLALHAGNVDYWESTPGVDVGYFGSYSEINGVRYWGLRLNGTVYSSDVQVVQGQPVFVVFKIQFGPVNTVSFYLNPALASEPATPDLQATTVNPLSFQSLTYASGWDAHETAIDEIRVASDYGSVISSSVVSPAAPTNLSVASSATQVALSWTPVAGATSYQVWKSTDSGDFQFSGTSIGPSYSDTSISAGGAYSYYVLASNSAGTSVASTQTPAFPRPILQSKAALGANLMAISDWTREWPFVDIFKLARPWISQQSGASWGEGGPLNLTPEGWVASLQPGQYAETIIFDNALDDSVAHFPSGNYTILYDGSGTLEFDLNTATIVSQTPGRMVVNGSARSTRHISEIDPNRSQQSVEQYPVHHARL